MSEAAQVNDMNGTNATRLLSLCEQEILVINKQRTNAIVLGLAALVAASTLGYLLGTANPSNSAMTALRAMAAVMLITTVAIALKRSAVDYIKALKNKKVAQDRFARYKSGEFK